MDSYQNLIDVCKSSEQFVVFWLSVAILVGDS